MKTKFLSSNVAPLVPLILWSLASSALAQTVATPTFLPAEGTALTRFPVVVTCPTSGAVIRYTVTGAEPTVFDPVVASGGTIDLARNMTLKAKAWNGGNSSSTASTTFEVTGDLSGGSQTLLALVTNGKVMGWGNDDFGRLANNSSNGTNILAPIAATDANGNIGTAVRISAGGKHGLMLDSSGNVWGFGNNTSGEAGRSTPTELLYARQVATNSGATTFLTGSTKISAGLDFSAALESSGHVSVWGSQVNGRLSNNQTTGSRKFAGRVETASGVQLTGIRDIALGKDFALAREANAMEVAGATGKVWVWGYNNAGNLALGNTTTRTYATNAKVSSSVFITDAWDIDAGDDFAAVVRWKTGDSNVQGSVLTFGSRSNGRLGDNSTAATNNYPVEVKKRVGSTYSQLNNIKQISCGPGHTLALDGDGYVWSWGSNATGALGDNSTTDRNYAMKVKNVANNGDLINIERVAAGGIAGLPGFSAAVASDGTIYVWGSNANGLIANGTTSTTVFTKLPVVVNQLKTIPGFPTVSLASSVTTVNAPGAATITASVADPQGAGNLQKTEFFVDGVLHTTKTGTPWNASLTGLAEGTHHVYAKTTDNDLNVTTSLPVTFVIQPTLDSDSDGLLDSWEIQQFGNLSQNATGDPDNDKVSNLAEYTNSTNPNSSVDGNADGIPDDWAAWHLAQPTGAPASSLPPSGDPDQDELTNLAEYQNNTNPRLADSDNDTQSDWQELAQGTNPKDVNSLAAPFAVSAHKGTANLQVPMTLPNLTPANSYLLALTDNVPSTTGFLMTSSNVSGGPAYEWIEISTTGEHLTDFETDASTMNERSLGFSFPFYGASYSSVFISGQGFATLTDPGSWYPGDPMNFRAALPNVDGHRPLISPYQQYLEPHVQGDIYYKVFPGYAVIQWEQVKLYGFNARPTFQAVLYADGTVRFNYKSIPLTVPEGYWISGYLSGVQNAAGTDGIGASWYTTSQQGLPIHSLAPLSLRFGSPPAAGGPWVTASTTALSGDPLNWSLSFQPSELQPGTHDAVLQFRKTAGSPVLYRRIIRLTVLPLGASGNDTLTGTTGDDSLAGLGGNDTLDGHGGNDTLDGGEGNDTINGHAGNDTLIGGDGNDTMSGGDGNDTIEGGNGDDIISGNAGDDTIAGGNGKDVYHYALGDGNDTYTDIAGIHQANDATADYSDLHFGAGITPGMLRSRFNSSLGTLKFEVQGTTGGSVTINNWSSYSGSTDVSVSRRWRFHFQDGTVWSGQLFWNDDLSTPFEGFTGGISNDTLTGSAEVENFRGLQADDNLEGGAGTDNYHYQWGSGNDTINDKPGTGEMSTVYISGENLENNLTYEFVAPAHLKIRISHPSDLSKNGSIILQDWYLASPLVYKDNWRVVVQGRGGNHVDISQKMRYMGTDGPDLISNLPFHTGNGQTFDAGPGDDSVSGSYWGETILGGLGNDTLSGQGGNDTLDGGDGNDTLNGGADQDTLLGGAGADFLTGDNGNDSLFGGEGQDILAGGSGDDLLEGGAGDDQLDGGDGNDTFRGGTGNDSLNGGAGSDIYEWNPGDGQDSITDSLQESAPGIENQLSFGTGVEPGRVLISKGPEKSLIFSVRNTVNEEIGRITIENWFMRNDVVSGTGNHSKTWRIHFADSPVIWDGRYMTTPGPDFLTGTAGDDSLQGGADNDTLQGLGGQDILAGGDGNDTLEGGDGNDDLSGGDGRDLLTGGNGNDILKGGNGSDSIEGNAGDDHLYGGAGNDVLTGGDGFDTYHWAVGDGNDTLVEHPSSNVPGEINTISFSGEVAPGTEISSQHVKVTSTGPGYGFFSIFDPSGNRIAVLTVRNWNETKAKWRVMFPQDQTPSNWNVLAEVADPDLDGVYEGDSGGGTAGVTNGTAYGDFIVGAAGNDVIGGLDGDDQISGLAGNDMINGGSGSDILSGGDGNDQLLGGSGADMIYGGAGNDSIQGGDDDDVLSGGSGNDVIDGGNGNDILYGQAGSDSLDGGAGNDILEGGSGDDSLSGGPGADTYRWNLGDGNDVIRDTAGDDGENPEENVVVLGPGIELEQIRQELVPASGSTPAFVKVTILDESQQPVGSFAAALPEASAPVSRLGLVVRTHTGKNAVLVTPGRDVLVLPGVAYDIDTLGGDDEISFVNEGPYDRTYTVKAGEGDDKIFCTGAKNWITGGPGNDLISLTQKRNMHDANVIYWNIGDGHDHIVRKERDYQQYTATCEIILGPGVSTTDCTVEVIEGLPKGSAAIKLVIHDAQRQVIGSIRVDGVLAITRSPNNYGVVSPSPISEYVSHGWGKHYQGPGYDFHEAAYMNVKFRFADNRFWGPLKPHARGYSSYETGLSDIDGDLMDDQWEIAHGMDPLMLSHWGLGEGFENPTETPADDDGMSSSLEYAFRTNPVVADAVVPLVFEMTGNDGDLMSIAYEDLNGLNNSVNDGMEDKDGDGIPNVWEFLRGTRADDDNDRPAPDYIVDPAAGSLSITDNIVSTLGEAAQLANMKGSYATAPEGFTEHHRYSIVEVTAGIYKETVMFRNSVLLCGKPGANKELPAILGPEDGQTLTLVERSSMAVPTMISGIRISHIPGKLGPAIVSEYDLYLRNVVIDHNVSDLGSAVYGRISGIDQCTIFNNVSPGGIYFAYTNSDVRIRNSILWGNSDPALVASGYNDDPSGITYTVENSIIQGGFMGATNVDPQLHRLGSLKSTSPAIDALVLPVGGPSTRDIHGEVRTADGTPDIGADEYTDDNSTSDGDGIPDWVEAATDGDTLSSAAEYTTHLTDPYLTDTDFDGLADDAEVLTYLTDPLVGDTDGDGISDGTEVRIGTPPTVPNDDGDSLPDEWEFDHGLDPNSDDEALDLDGDGLTNAQEHALGTNPNSRDTDGDGMTDDWELANGQDPVVFSLTPPTVLADADADGLVGWVEIAFNSSLEDVDTDADGWNDSFEYVAQTDPNSPDSDGDGTLDLDEDSDGDGLSNRDELEVHHTNPVSKDTDGDEVDDDKEIMAQMDPNDPEDGSADPDADGLATSKELEIGTNPNSRDSDGDGISDGLEHGGGLNPLNPDSDSDGVPDLDEDTDGDGLTNRQEFERSTHMLYQDTDLDGINDALEN